jgi:hypothetical protein
MAKATQHAAPAAAPQPTPTASAPAALAAAPSAAAQYAAALAALYPQGKGKAYAPKPTATLALALGPAALAQPGSNPKAVGSATHGRWAAMVAGMAAAQAAGQPYTVAMALATGLPMGDITWALAPCHKGAQLVVVR